MLNSHLPESPRFAVIGETVGDKHGSLYKKALADRGIAYESVDVEELLRSIVSRTGQSLLDHVHEDPHAAALNVTAWNLEALFDFPFDAAIITDASGTFGPHLPALVNALAQTNTVLANSPLSVANGRNKWASYEIAQRVNAAVPRAVLVSNEDEYVMAAKTLGLPVVVKGLRGTEGEEVRKADTMEMLLQVGKELELGEQPLMVQHYMECSATDRRIIVVNGQAVAAMERRAVAGDFRANLSLGGTGHVVEAQPDEIALAESMARALGLSLTGIDVARVTKTLAGREYLPEGDVFFLEANVFPGIAGISKVTGTSIADLVIDSLLRQIEMRDYEIA